MKYLIIFIILVFSIIGCNRGLKEYMVSNSSPYWPDENKPVLRVWYDDNKNTLFLLNLNRDTEIKVGYFQKFISYIPCTARFNNDGSKLFYVSKDNLFGSKLWLNTWNIKEERSLERIGISERIVREMRYRQ